MAWCRISFSNWVSNPVFYAHHLFLDGLEIKDLIIPSTIAAIGPCAFNNCSGLTSVTIPNSVTSIGSFAFSGCNSLMSVNIPNSVTSLGEASFSGCSSLISLSIPNSVTSIGSSAFSECSSLKSVDIPNSVTSLGEASFSGCSSLISLYIPNSVSSIGEHAFNYCYRIKTIIWDAVNCMSVGSYAFNDCDSIFAFQFGNGVEHIPAGMPSLSMSGKTLVLPNSVKTIDSGAFTGSCGAVVIGDNIENITAGAFPTGISVAYATPAEPRPCEEGAFANPQTLYVPSGSKMKYFTSEGWSEFANIVEGEYVRAASIALNKSTATLSKGGTQQLTATIWPSNASAASVTWLSMNPAVATVSSDGKVTAIALGETDIVAMVDNVRATCHVTVIPDMVNSLTLSDTQLNMELNEMYTLAATVLPTSAENQTLEWIIPDNNVIVTQVVNNTRLNIGAIGTGSVTITVRTTDGSNLSATCTVNVQVSATSISLNMTSAEMTVDGVLQLTATVLPTNATNRTVTWKSSNTSIATVNSSGLVTAKSPGSAIITATTTDGTNLSATCSLFVKQNIVYASSISLNKSSANLVAGQQMQLQATVLPENTTNKTVIWSSSDPSVAIIDEDGLVTAITSGTTTITVTTTDGSNLSASCVVTVTEDNYNNYLSMNDTDAFHGETIVIPVAMTNESTIISFQTDIYLPEGLEVVQEDGEFVIDPSERMTRTHSIMSNAISNGAIRVLCYSSNYKPFTGNSGDDLFYITVKVADDAEGDYTIWLKNTLLTNSDFEELMAPNVAANIHVNAYLPGDANGSGTVTVTDVVVTSQYVLELNPQPFVFGAADVNADNNITVTDMTRIAWMVLNPSLSMPMRAPALYNNGDIMSGKNITLMPGETRTVSIVLDNVMDYSAFQFDLNLPTGLTATNFQLTDRAGYHAFDVNVLSNGKTRALCYSPALEVINGHNGALLTFDVTANSAIEGAIEVDNIELVTSACQTVKLNGFAIGVNTVSSINELANGKTIARVDYFNMAGQQIDQPDGGVTLVVTTYTDGTRTTNKIIR